MLSACGLAESVQDRAAAHLAQGMGEAHERALAERANDPASRGAAAADRLGNAISEGDNSRVVAATATPTTVEVVTTLGVRAEKGGGLTYEQATLGACLRIRATPGVNTGDADRGTVETAAVPCPEGTVMPADGAPVEAMTTDLPTLRSAVPAPEPEPCFSGSGDCVGG